MISRFHGGDGCGDDRPELRRCNERDRRSGSLPRTARLAGGFAPSIASRKKIVGVSKPPAFIIASLRSAEAAKSLAFLVSSVSKTTTISLLLLSAEWQTRGLIRPAALCISTCQSKIGRHRP